MNEIPLPTLVGELAECQNCGHIVIYANSLDLCVECGAGHWCIPPTHPLGDFGRKMTEDGSCPTCGPECRFDGSQAVLTFRNDHDDNPVHIQPPKRAKQRLIEQRHLTAKGELPESHPFHPKNLAKSE